MDKRQIRAFRKTVYDSYRAGGRQFPWRQASDPYRILVSEVMLQQTQTDRVLPKHEEFVRQFPDLSALAAAPLADVMRAWQGLGYNRRALALWRAAQAVEADCHGRLPASVDKLLALPGVGNYTARAVAAFAYNQPTVFIETKLFRHN